MKVKLTKDQRELLLTGHVHYMNGKEYLYFNDIYESTEEDLVYTVIPRNLAPIKLELDIKDFLRLNKVAAIDMQIASLRKSLINLEKALYEKSFIQANPIIEPFVSSTLLRQDMWQKVLLNLNHRLLKSIEVLNK